MRVLALVRVRDWGPELALGLVPGQERPLASHRHRRRPAAVKKLPRSQRPGPDYEEQRQSAQRRKGAWSRVSLMWWLVGWAVVRRNLAQARQTGFCELAVTFP